MLNTQLSKVYFDEALKEAAQARADRKAQTGSRKNVFSGLLFVLVATPVIFWFFR